MTNREKYIDKASNEELSKLLANKCFITATDKITYNVFGKGKENDLYSIEKWLSQEAELTADEMFEELGYIMDKEYEISIIYNNINTVPKWQIIIDTVSLHFGKSNKNNVPMLITEAEDKAIHKKIEELKGRKE